MLLDASRKQDVHLGGADAAALDRLDSNRHLRRTQPGGEPANPLSGRTRGDERPQEHVPADPGGRVNDGKASISHRLINMAPGQTGGKPPDRDRATRRRC